MLHLTQVAARQTAELAQTRNAVEQMTQSIRAVAVNAQQTTGMAASTELEELAIDKTVQRLLRLQETVAHTARKVQRLDESSQQISQVVSSIHQIALQIPLLKMNATLATAPPQDTSQDLAPIAAEKGDLAVGSVLQDVKLQDAQLQDAHRSIKQIVEASHQVEQLIRAIARATVSQAQTSQAVAQLIQAIASASEPTSEVAHSAAAFLAQASRQTQSLLDPVHTSDQS
jgi:methyl-accepting chemotaxis protein